jgi:valyl-tRNA synthetase
VRIKLYDDALRIFEAVVRPSADAEQGDVEAEIGRLEKEVARAEGKLGNEKFVTNAAPDVVEGEREKLARYRAELEALRG